MSEGLGASETGRAHRLLASSPWESFGFGKPVMKSPNAQPNKCGAAGYS